jgi:hypothetical protein
MKDLNEKDYWVECGVCGQLYHNWVGSTPCCGSLAFIRTEISFRKDKLKRILSNIKRI